VLNNQSIGCRFFSLLFLVVVTVVYVFIVLSYMLCSFSNSKNKEESFFSFFLFVKSGNNATKNRKQKILFCFFLICFLFIEKYIGTILLKPILFCWEKERARCNQLLEFLYVTKENIFETKKKLIKKNKIQEKNQQLFQNLLVYSNTTLIRKWGVEI